MRVLSFKTILGGLIMDLKELFSKLDVKGKDALIQLTDPKWKEKVSFPSRVVRLLENANKWSPKAIFCFDNKPLILFFENPENQKELHKAIWNFNETPIVIISENEKVTVYNGFILDKNKELLKRIGGDDVLSDFTYIELVTGKTFKTYEREFHFQNRVDYKLLKNIEETQNELLNKHKCDRLIANALLGKVIFIRYLIDRRVKLNFKGESKVWTNNEFCDLLDDREQVFKFFEYLKDPKKGFNGNLFPIDKVDYDNIPDGVFGLLRRLLEGDNISKKQKSLFCFYDFSVLPIEFISNVYERFIGKENQAKAGAYYTPTFLVDYIISQTVTKRLNENKELTTCKVLDPACGSGIFLVESLRKIIEKHISVNGMPEDSSVFKETIKQLATDNIFGIDKDESAVQVAIFSIYLTLLDYQEPPDIETFQFPLLLGTNFFIDDFFDTDAEYNVVLKSVSFDYILGNPPWFRGKGEKETPLYVDYIIRRAKEEKQKDKPSCEIGGREIAQAFLIRTSDFSNSSTQNALIVTSKTLYNLKSDKFRSYFLQNYRIQRVFELAPVRREVFEKSNKKAITPACVLFFEFTESGNTDNNIIEHITLKPSRFFSLFKIFSICRTDFKKVQQKKLKNFDWLWKVLVYGSYLDFNFILRLKEDFITIDKYLKSFEIIRKQGLKRVDGGKKIDVTELTNWDFLDLTKKEIKQNYISKTHKPWKFNEVGYIYRENGKICKKMFSPPMLLVKETVNAKLESVAAVSSQRLLFTDKITSIKYRNNDDVRTYYLLAAYLNSSLFAYYAINTSSTAGIMIEQQINDEERFSFPFAYSDIILKKEEDLRLLMDSFATNTMADNETIIDIAEKKKGLDKSICDVFGLTEVERELYQYAIDVTIPIQMKSKKHREYLINFAPVDIDHPVLKDYAQLYINRFASSLSRNGKKFFVEIWHSDQLIGMLFKLIDESEYDQEIKFQCKQNNRGIVNFIIKAGTQKITEQLFIQKDVRGFDRDLFYIFKPNEKRLWHKAIGYLDVDEFADAMLKVGRGAK